MMIDKASNIELKLHNLANERTLVRLFWIFTFVVITAIGAQIEIPNHPVPFTLQTFFVFMAGAFLGKRDGTISMGLYLLLGSAGLPVFAGGAFGLAKILGPTGGYLLAFPIAAFTIGYLSRFRNNYLWVVFTMCIGSIIIFLLGTIQLNFVYFNNWTNSIKAGFLIFSWWDIVKIVGSSAIAHYYFNRVKIS